MIDRCRTAWGICPHDGHPLTYESREERSCRVCGRISSTREVEPCPLPADVLVDSGFGVGARMCHWHAQAFLNVSPDAVVLQAPSDFPPQENVA